MENNNQEVNNYINQILIGGRRKKKLRNKTNRDLSDNNSENSKNERFNCEPENKFSEICSSNSKGYYNSKSSCMNYYQINLY